jgi:hypothetical protein
LLLVEFFLSRGGTLCARNAERSILSVTFVGNLFYNVTGKVMRAGVKYRYCIRCGEVLLTCMQLTIA